jgi:predicted unusual protein kinase regulating ubiquinone biosynthesis (AarF/ABC1/UbiB family)
VSQHQLARLKKYDRQAIADYYRYRPWQAIWRSLRIVFSFAGWLLGIQLDQRTGQVEQNKLKRATKLRQILTKLGPTFIKVGQALSTRPDLVRQDFLEELIKLQDQLPPFDNAIAFRIIEKQLDRTIEELYTDISPGPVAAASLGQVYKARLRDSGDEVAVKVQRPNLKPTLTLDLYLMRLGAKWLAPWLPLNLGHDLTLIVDEFGIKLFEEVDYCNEARNAEKFAVNFQNNPQVKVPKIYWRYSSDNVLTLEWINGYKLTGTQHLEEAGINTTEIVEIGVTSVCNSC